MIHQFLQIKNNIEALLKMAQADAQLWEGLLSATGGRIRTEKVFLLYTKLEMGYQWIPSPTNN
jgi:hypothetical protein